MLTGKVAAHSDCYGCRRAVSARLRQSWIAMGARADLVGTVRVTMCDRAKAQLLAGSVYGAGEAEVVFTCIHMNQV